MWLKGSALNNQSRELHKFMREEGFELIRADNHYVWFDGAVRVVTAKTVSDRRAIQKAKSLLKRIRRNVKPAEKVAG